MKCSEELPATVIGTPQELDDYVAAYEAARAGNDRADPAAFLPPPEHPLYGEVLRELIRVDLEYAWLSGQRRRLEDYQVAFAQLFQDPVALREIAFEEYRLRRLAGENVSPDEYAQRFRVDTADWPDESCAAEEIGVRAREPALAVSGDAGAPAGLQRAARAYQEFRLFAGNAGGDVDDWCSRLPAQTEQAEVFRQAHHTDPAAALRLARAMSRFPEPGQEFLGFRLLKELGQGAFGRVYLAEQASLAGRRVVLKIATDIFGESQTLARLQHTNIVPIYSTHRAEDLQAVCMPYFGATTLADVLGTIRSGATPPASGKVLISTLNNRKASTRGPGRSPSGQTLQETAAAAGATVDGEPAETAAVRDLLQNLEGMSYVHAVFWIGARLADGLAHAHERGILHRDLKPANVLLTDDGQPMLLDFNLAADAQHGAGAAAAAVGGTLPYMAPEQLKAFRGFQQTLDAHSDIYSLGVILHELLTGRHPFPAYRGVSHEVVDRMLADRSRPLPPAHALNPAITPAVEAILRHCLEPDPQCRYQNARELYEDLERQRNHLPLRHVAEPSLRERCRKFVHRHPRLTSLTSVGVAAAILLLTLAAAMVFQKSRLARLEAVDLLRTYHEEAQPVKFTLYARAQESGELDEAVLHGRAALARYHVLDSPDWRQLPAYHHLPSAEQAKLREEIGELLFLVARGTERQAVYQKDESARRELWHEALHLNELAATCWNSGAGSGPLWKQRAHLAEHLGDRELVRQYLEKAKQAPVQDTRDLYLEAHELAINGNYRAALPLLLEVTRRDPRSYSAWAVRGNCHDFLNQNADALACYNACVALRPTDPRAWHNRGLIYLKQRFFQLALADFDQAIALRDDVPEPYIDRALAKKGLNRYREAVEDFSAALQHHTSITRVYFMRARARDQAGDHEGAKRDLADGMRLEPADYKSWVARGEARRQKDPQGALADFQRALDTNPVGVEALQNIGGLLSERLNRPAEAIRILDKAVSLYPDYVPARAGRGVLLARAGRTEAAEEDARESLLRDTRAPNLYQVAGIYALNSRKRPGDRVQALHLLSEALRAGFGLDLVDKDTDLDPIRDNPEFHRVVNAARQFRAAGGRQSK
ncbi:MAG TPA: protein kinase [Gemmataceae bacterium]|nr:protein kinase [Gemmataceae bacterium]